MNIADNQPLVSVRFPSGVCFSPSKSALVSSLFNPGGTASGFFKMRANGILFCRGNGDAWFFLVANKHGERFFVTCGKQSDGRTVYMHSLSEYDRVPLGIPEKMLEAHALAESVWTFCNR